MDEITEANCKIGSAVLHVVDNRIPQLALADEALSLDADRVIFLRTHIVKSIDQSSVAVFNDRGSNEVSLSSERVFAKPSALLTESKRLATRLFDFMKPRTINPGTFWTITFGSENSSSYLALIKMDDIPTFRYEPVNEKGKNIINLSKLSHALPNLKMKLDKAAFIIPAATEGFDYELRVLDKKLPEEAVATYFTEFLSFHAPQTDLEKTRIFVTAVESWIKQNSAELPDTMTEQQLRELKRSYLSNNREISLKRFAKAAFGDKYPKLRAGLVAHLREEGLRDPKFKVHETEWSKHSGRLAYRLTSGSGKTARTVEIRGDLDAVRTMVEIKERTPNDQQYHAIITADQLEEVVPR